MAKILHIHPKNPQMRLLQEVVQVIENGGVVVYPTDSAYALGCQLGNKAAADRIRRIRNLDKNHNFTVVCHDLSEIATYANVDNAVFRLLKANTPGPYTYILPASKEVPRRLQHPKRKTIGIRVPDNIIVQSLLTELKAPLMSVTLILPNSEEPVATPEENYEQLEHQVDLIIEGGFCGVAPTTVVDFVNGKTLITRIGKGDPTPFQ